MKVLYWFRRDLRIDDNRGFIKACQLGSEVVPIFIFSEYLLERFNTKDQKLGFLVSAIEQLDNKLKNIGSKLYCFKGNESEIFEKIITIVKPHHIITTKSKSWSGEKIEQNVKNVAKKYSVNFETVEDGFLNTHKIPYTKVFTPFYKKWINLIDVKISPFEKAIKTPDVKLTNIDEIKKELNYSKHKIFDKFDTASMLSNFDFKNYANTRDLLDIDGTTKLSHYIRFGIVSVRKIYHHVSNIIGNDNQFVKELSWREFWYHIKENFNNFNNLEFQEKRRGIQWINNEKLFDAFINATTGYPIIDAAINQLKRENWMHGRARMIVASFLTKDLLIDWRWGERFFMEYLLDYDEAVNTGNWQWSASVGPDPKPMRIFNPILQSKKFDPNALYIKKYLPELKDISPDLLHDPLTNKLPYHKPIVNHYEMSKLAKEIYLKSKTQETTCME